MINNDVSSDRVQLRYQVAGLSPREELLLKSLIRLLSHRTHHQWACSPERVHLQIAGSEQAATPMAATDGGQSLPLLVVGHIAPALPTTPYLRLPLHANELELMLNKLGHQVLQTQRPMVAIPDSTENKGGYRLRRWPPAALLTTSPRIRLATLLTGHTLSLAELHQRSGQTQQECASFLHDLQAAGILQGEADAQEKPPQPPAPRIKPAMGLLARIRGRLGLG